MSLLDVKNALFNNYFNEKEGEIAEKLCQVFSKQYWEWRYAELMKNYAYPVWFPHRLDLANWQFDRNPHFLERGIYSHQVIRPGDDVLELCCGDGFYSYYFFSGKAKQVDALDIDDLALNWARRYHYAPNINYLHIDIVNDAFPKPKYDVVIWDGAIRRLKREDIETTLDKVVNVLKPTNGIFSCYEILDTNEYYLTPMSLDDMRDLFLSRFPIVQYIQTNTPGRPKNFYFHCYFNEDERVGKVNILKR